MPMNMPFERAVSQHGPTVMRVVCAVLGVGPDADDAWSETFLAAMSAWPDLDANTNIEAWLVRVAHRKAIDIVRKTGRQAVTMEDLPEKPSQHGVPHQSGVEIWELVATLPERQRLAVALHYLGGLRHAEVAELIGSSPDAVRRAAADGTRNLRQHFLTETNPKEANQ